VKKRRGAFGALFSSSKPVCVTGNPSDAQECASVDEYTDVQESTGCQPVKNACTGAKDQPETAQRLQGEPDGRKPGAPGINFLLS